MGSETKRATAVSEHSEAFAPWFFVPDPSQCNRTPQSRRLSDFGGIQPGPQIDAATTHRRHLAEQRTRRGHASTLNSTILPGLDSFCSRPQTYADRYRTQGSTRFHRLTHH